ncbi:MAG: efflux RND transporter permease subunit [Saprospiraceae bacterium]
MGRSFPTGCRRPSDLPTYDFLLGIPRVKSIRSNSMFGFSSIYIIFDDNIEFYWSRSRILEKLNSLPANLLPSEVQPSLGPDATALGQIFWYTLEGRDENGQPTGGWDPQELRSIQDFYVRFGLSGAEGVSEVASIGGFVKEYQVDVDPDAMKANRISLEQVMQATAGSNIDVGAQTIEINLGSSTCMGFGLCKKSRTLKTASSPSTTMSLSASRTWPRSALGQPTVRHFGQLRAEGSGWWSPVMGSTLARYPKCQEK